MVSPLRLREFGQLQAWLNRVVPNPLEEARDSIDAADGDARLAVLGEVLGKLATWPVRYGSELGGKLFSTEAGARFFLAVALSRSDADATEELIVHLVKRITADEWRRLSCVLFASDPLEEVTRLLDTDPKPQAPGEDLNWSEAFAQVAESTGWTFAAIADLTLAQWSAIRTGGKAINPFEPRHGESYADADRRRRKLLYGDEAFITEAEKDQLRAAAALFPGQAVLPEGI